MSTFIGRELWDLRSTQHFGRNFTNVWCGPFPRDQGPAQGQATQPGDPALIWCAAGGGDAAYRYDNTNPVGSRAFRAVCAAASGGSVCDTSHLEIEASVMTAQQLMIVNYKVKTHLMAPTHHQLLRCWSPCSNKDNRSCAAGRAGALRVGAHHHHQGGATTDQGMHLGCV